MYQYIGVDVSNQTLQVFDGLKDLTFPNEPKLKEFNLFVREWKKKIKQREASGTELVIIFEPTGPYSSHLREYCSKKELKAHIMNPMQSSYFAKKECYYVSAFPPLALPRINCTMQISDSLSIL